MKKSKCRAKREVGGAPGEARSAQLTQGGRRREPKVGVAENPKREARASRTRRAKLAAPTHSARWARPGRSAGQPKALPARAPPREAGTQWAPPELAEPGPVALS